VGQTRFSIVAVLKRNVINSGMFAEAAGQDTSKEVDL
jgi:hypothetical protein